MIRQIGTSIKEERISEHVELKLVSLVHWYPYTFHLHVKFWCIEIEGLFITLFAFVFLRWRFLFVNGRLYVSLKHSILIMYHIFHLTSHRGGKRVFFYGQRSNSWAKWGKQFWLRTLYRKIIWLLIWRLVHFKTKIFKHKSLGRRRTEYSMVS